MSKEYHQSKAKEHYWKNKEEYQKRNAEQRQRTKRLLEEAKSCGCILCRENEKACLDFHHLGDKDMTISQMHGMNDERVKAEVAKCVVLCANCHRKVHAGLVSIILV